MAPRAKQREASRAGFGLVLEERVNVRLPQTAPAFGLRGEVHKILDIEIQWRLTGQPQLVQEFRPDRPQLPAKEFPPPAALEMQDVIAPVNQVLQKLRAKRRTEMNAIIAGVRRHAVDQRKERNLFALRMKFARHFVGNVAPKQ